MKKLLDELVLILFWLAVILLVIAGFTNWFAAGALICFIISVVLSDISDRTFM